MKRPKTREVGEVLREKKLFHLKLNNVDVRKWDEKQLQEWYTIIGSDYVVAMQDKEPPTPSPCAIKVMRMDDGIVFSSITECIRVEGLHKTLMLNLLNDGIEYKRIEK